MIRRQFNLPLDGNAYREEVQLLVTYDPDTDTMHVGSRENDYDTWSTPLPLVSSDDDPVGRTGGLGSTRGAQDVTFDQAVIERLRAIVNEADNQANQVDPATAQQVAAVPNQTSRPAPDTTAMQEDPRRDRRGS